MLHCEYNVSLTHPCVEHEKLVRPKRISNTLFFTHHETSETSLCNSDTLNSFVFFNHFSINSDAIIISSKSRSICSNQTVFTATWIRNDSIGWHRESQKEQTNNYLQTTICISARAPAALLDSVEHFPLHAVLQLAPPQHQVEDFVDGVLRIFLQQRNKPERLLTEEDGKLSFFMILNCILCQWPRLTLGW